MATPVMVPEVPVMPVPLRAPRPGEVSVCAWLAVVLLDEHTSGRRFIVVMMLNDPTLND
jgi:hypothetical protein